MKATLSFLMLLLPVMAGELSGRRAPSFALPDMQMKYHDILDYRGKPVVIEFMTTGCPHCQTLATTLESIKAKYRGRVTFFNVVIPPDNQQTVANFIARTRSTSTFLFDCGQATGIYLKASPQKPSIDMPHLFFIDAQGMIRDDYGSTKASDLSGAAISGILDKLLMTGGAPAAAKPAVKK